MAHTCAVQSCRNNRRNPGSVIIMPHVGMLRWHVVREPDYETVHELLSRPDRMVTKWTNICSNHYKGGRPLDASRIPCLYMDGYPEWVCSLNKVNDELQNLEDSFLNPILSFLCQYLNPLNATQILKTISLPAAGNASDVGALQKAALALSTGLAREMLMLVQRFVSNGNKHEALVIHKYGAVLDDAKIAVDAKHMLEGKMYGCMPTPKTMHNYATSSLPITQQHIQMLNGRGAYPECTEKVQRSTSQQIRLKAQKLQRKVTFMEIQRAEHQLITKRLHTALKEAERKVKTLMEKMQRPLMSVDRIRENDSLVEMHTGLPTYSLFKWVLAEVSDAAALAAQKLRMEQLESEPKKEDHVAAILAVKGLDMTDKAMHVESESEQSDTDTAESDTVEGEGMDCELVESEWVEKVLEKTEQEQAPMPCRSPPVSLENQLLLTLVKLRMGLDDEYLAYQFDIPARIVSSIVCIWLRLLSSQLEGLIHWPTAADITKVFPTQFHRWSGLIAVFCTIDVRLAQHTDSRSFVVSSSAGSSRSCKFLVACSPSGTISYVSRPIAGCLSDVDVAKKCRFMDMFCPGDRCMAAHSFDLENELLDRGVDLIRPAALVNDMVTVETHPLKLLDGVVRAIRSYRYLCGEIPLRYLNHLGDAVTVCCALNNLKKAQV